MMKRFKNSEAKEENDQKLSTTARIRLATLLFIESYSSKTDVVTDLNHPFPVSLSGLSDDEGKDSELLVTLLASAEKTGQRQFDSIRHKINREFGKVADNGLDQKMQMFDLHEELIIHTILQHVKEAKIHVIDLKIRTGTKYIVMLQDLASREHLECFKLTAVGTRAESRIQDTGRRVAEYAKSMNIPFTFKIVMVSNMLNFNIDLLELDEHEKVAVCAPFFLSTLISKPNFLEDLMRLIRKINPSNNTTPAFANRFTQALFFYGLLFDSMSDCLANDDRHRKVSESVICGQSIHNIVAADGDERTIRHIGVDVWRSFFVRFGMVEIELSSDRLFEEKLFDSNFDCGKFCTVRVNGGCLLIDWKDVPIFSVSAWKFV
nr:hypothetical protein [Tanacetum cinerariifolium]